MQFPKMRKKKHRILVFNLWEKIKLEIIFLKTLHQSRLNLPVASQYRTISGSRYSAEIRFTALHSYLKHLVTAKTTLIEPK